MGPAHGAGRCCGGYRDRRGAALGDRALQHFRFGGSHRGDACGDTHGHRKNGFFIINKGGGIEYCLAIAVSALVPGVLGSGRYSLDEVWNFAQWTPGVRLVLVLCLGVGTALAQLAVFYRPSRARA